MPLYWRINIMGPSKKNTWIPLFLSQILLQLSTIWVQHDDFKSIGSRWAPLWIHKISQGAKQHLRSRLTKTAARYVGIKNRPQEKIKDRYILPPTPPQKKKTSSFCILNRHLQQAFSPTKKRKTPSPHFGSRNCKATSSTSPPLKADSKAEANGSKVSPLWSFVKFFGGPRSWCFGKKFAT